jgi:hypothetical protein
MSAPLRGAAWVDTAIPFERRQGPPIRHLQAGRSLFTPTAGHRCHMHHSVRAKQSTRRSGMGKGAARTSARSVGERRLGQQDGTHRLGATDTQRSLCRSVLRNRLTTVRSERSRGQAGGDGTPVEPGREQAAVGSSAVKRVDLYGTPAADFIRASGHVHRVNRPDT